MNNRMVSFDNINENKKDFYMGLDLSKETDRTTYVIISDSKEKTEDKSKENNSDNDVK